MWNKNVLWTTKVFSIMSYLQFLFVSLVCQSHFSIKKGAAALGIGTESVICIKADER